MAATVFSTSLVDDLAALAVDLVTVVGLIVAGGVIRQGYKTLAVASSKPDGDKT